MKKYTIVALYYNTDETYVDHVHAATLDEAIAHGEGDGLRRVISVLPGWHDDLLA